MKQGIITQMPKPNKDKRFLSWRPITLLNSDCKILAAVYAKRLKPCLEVISLSQYGFMKDRHISNNIRLVLDLLDYSELVNNDDFVFRLLQSL